MQVQQAIAEIDTPGGFDIRIVKRAADVYVSQVWGAAFYRVVGTYTTRHAARQAAHAFIATDPVDPSATEPARDGWQRRRSSSHAPQYRCIRKVKGLNTWQARPWLGPRGKSLNLGLFTFEDHGEDAEWAAAQVAKMFAREWKPGKTVGEVVDALKAAGKVRRDLVVPACQRKLKPPKNRRDPVSADVKRERERRTLAEQERRRYQAGTLVDAA